MDDPGFAKEYRKEITIKMTKNGVSHQVKGEWYNIKKSIIAMTEEITGGKKKNTEMKNGMMMNAGKP